MARWRSVIGLGAALRAPWSMWLGVVAAAFLAGDIRGRHVGQRLEALRAAQKIAAYDQMHQTHLEDLRAHSIALTRELEQERRDAQHAIRQRLGTLAPPAAETCAIDAYLIRVFDTAATGSEYVSDGRTTSQSFDIVP